MALISCALVALLLTYATFSLVGQLHVGRFASLGGLALLTVVVAAAVWVVTRRNLRRGRALMGVVAWALVALVVSDGLLYFRVVRLPRVDRIDAIPAREPIITTDGYRTYVHQRMWSADVMSVGQAAAGLPDTGFYEPRRLRVVTDELGFRNAPGSALRAQDVVLLGDSFAFGYALDQEDLWSVQLARLTGKNVYNLALYGSSPSEGVELLRHFTERDAVKLSARPVILLHVFEGNDFTDPSVYRYRYEGPRPVTEVRNILAQWFDEGLLGQALMRGRRLLSPARSTQGVVDSARFGRVAFHIPYMNEVRALDASPQVAAAYFASSAVPSALQRLAEVARRLSARVLVMYQPTRYRVYGRYFPDLPAVPRDRHMSALLRSAAMEHGFEYVDLTSAFEARAENGEMLFWRDDTHLNGAGHRLLAELTRDLLARSRSDQASTFAPRDARASTRIGD